MLLNPSLALLLTLARPKLPSIDIRTFIKVF